MNSLLKQKGANMEIGSTSNVAVAGGSSKPTTVGFGDMKTEDFFAMMIAQLQQQDPLKPQDNQQLLSQMSNIRQIEQSTRLGDTLEAQMKALQQQTKILQGLTSQKFNDPASLIGLYVQGPGVGDSGDPVIGSDGKPTKVEGIVIGVDYTSAGRAVLKLHNGTSIVADTVEKVKIVVPDDGAGGSDDAGTPIDNDGNPDDSDAANDDAARIKAGMHTAADARHVNGPQQMDTVAGLLDSLFSQGLGVRVAV
ncbi:MAG: hypothetical protein KF841_01835 [Phycisphaerae bacterium]|nr:hypothetical protein [Phycisphaerae bacterium]